MDIAHNITLVGTLKYWEQQSVIEVLPDSLESGAMYSAVVVFQTVYGTDISEVEVTSTFCKW